MLNKLIKDRQEVALYYTDRVSTKTMYGFIAEVDNKMGLVKIICNQRESIFPLTSIVRIEPVAERHCCVER
jgi:hypothetical protein